MAIDYSLLPFPANLPRHSEAWGSAKTPLTNPGIKGQGFFGPLLDSNNQVATELSEDGVIAGKKVSYPLLVPTLTQEERQWLLSGKEPTEEIRLKAQQHAQQRLLAGQSPFAKPNEPVQPTKPAKPMQPASLNVDPDLSGNMQAIFPSKAP